MLGGAAAGWLGVRQGLFVCAAAGCFAFVPILLSPMRTMRKFPSSPDGDDEAHEGVAEAAAKR
ncbi:hypothetical protein ACIQOV_01310 [Kitasatospora sp. NPDC091257]|uniref:hypothetical protein n=1 Tax=Kitasatospora sp. NPDC091257 TaxID=3364084 RepID=UPI0037FE33A8